MKKTVLYQYLGTNGTILSPVHLEDVYYIRKIKLTADPNKLLTNGSMFTRTIVVAEQDVNAWHEVKDEGQM